MGLTKKVNTRLNLITLEPTCKVNVLAIKSWLSKRADLKSWLKHTIEDSDANYKKIDLIPEKILHLWTLQAGCSVIGLTAPLMLMTEYNFNNNQYAV